MRSGWVPNQHGAWAMLVVPFGFGLVLAIRADAAGWWLLPLFVCWLLGYFAFYYASMWLKAARRRRSRYVAPLLTYTAASAVSCLLSLTMRGWEMLWWGLPYLLLLLPALWLAHKRRERATAGGAVTVAAACLMTVLVRFPDPHLLANADWDYPALVAALLFVYFFGTVLYVKTNIRNRGDAGYFKASVGWHGASTLLAGALAASGVSPWWWPVFCALATLRAAAVPRLLWTPKRIGLLEVGFTLVLCGCFLTW